jgi:hypothetical protein
MHVFSGSFDGMRSSACRAPAGALFVFLVLYSFFNLVFLVFVPSELVAAVDLAAA